MFLIFRPGFLPAQSTVPLEPEEIRHIRARRLATGSDLYVGDGAGKRYRCRLGEGVAEILEPLQVEEGKERKVTLYTALPEGKRWDWLLQKSCELGVHSIQPVQFENSQPFRNPGSPREHRILEEAAVQSRRFHLPRLEKVRPFLEVLELCRRESALVLHPEIPGREGHFHLAADSLFVGPEGGFSPSEIENFRNRDFSFVRIGSPILRVETAAVAGLTLLLYSSGSNV